MKSLLKRITPAFLVNHYQRFDRHRRQKRDSERTCEEVFTEVYKKAKWGGAKGEYSSGLGTINDEIVAPYVRQIKEEASRRSFQGLTFVDLGCGDFSVGSQLLPLCSTYTGIDIVEPLIKRNQEMYGNSTTQFTHLDIVNDELPNGDVCFIRQVLQHLSNQQIKQVLEKMDKYQWVFVTEHLPSENDITKPNIDKVHGEDIRLFDNSGVDLSSPPFEIPKEQLTTILEVPGTGIGKESSSGVIRTVLYEPGS